MTSDDTSVLTSWKEIAAHLDVTVRTAQLWEKQRGLPVRRMPGPRSRVYLRIDEYEAGLQGQANQPDGPVDRFQSSADQPQGWTSWRRNVLAAAAVVVALLLGFFSGPLAMDPRPPGPPANGYVSGDIWITAFSRSTSSASYRCAMSASHPPGGRFRPGRRRRSTATWTAASSRAASRGCAAASAATTTSSP